MKDVDVWGLKRGEVSFARLAKDHLKYFESMASFFYRRAGWANPPCDEDDLVQLGLLACWTAVQSYEVRCPVCPRLAPDYQALSRHGERRHGGPVVPRNTLLRFVHRKVGSAMDHELYRHVRRSKFHGEMPVARPVNSGMRELRSEDFVPRSLRCDARQEAYAEFRMLLQKTEQRLSPEKNALFLKLLQGDVHASSARTREVTREVRRMARG